MSSVGDIPPGTYRGVVSGVESGHCTARIRGTPTEEITERSRATCRRADC